jgi:ATP-dependent RNA helicase DBP3
VQKKTIKPGSDESRTLVFVLYKNEAPRVETLLRKQGYSVCVLHGNISQDARQKALDDFKYGRVGVLIATDVAARGLDIPNVGTVINYTFPLTVEDYVHRIGRTGKVFSTIQEVSVLNTFLIRTRRSRREEYHLLHRREA